MNFIERLNSWLSNLGNAMTGEFFPLTVTLLWLSVPLVFVVIGLIAHG